MAGKKSRASRISNGGRQKNNVAKEANRQARFARRREAGKVYEYKTNPFKEGSKDWTREKIARAEKAKSSKLPYAYTISVFRKLDNKIAKEQEKAAKARMNTKKAAASA